MSKKIVWHPVWDVLKTSKVDHQTLKKKDLILVYLLTNSQSPCRDILRISRCGRMVAVLNLFRFRVVSASNHQVSYVVVVAFLEYHRISCFFYKSRHAGITLTVKLFFLLSSLAGLGQIFWSQLKDELFCDQCLAAVVGKTSQSPPLKNQLISHMF